jgi:hypothetical protein
MQTFVADIAAWASFGTNTVNIAIIIIIVTINITIKALVVDELNLPYYDAY